MVPTQSLFKASVSPPVMFQERLTFKRIRFIAIITFLVYLTFLLSLLVPAVQRNLLYLHKVRYPFKADFEQAGKYGLAPYKVRNLKVRTADNETLGAWHVLPHSVYIQQTTKVGSLAVDTLSEDIFDSALQTRPTIIYLHGNAASRAQSQRVRSISDYSYRLDCNVLALDYRGFADSSGSPSETGLQEDALAGWNWIVSHRMGGHSVEQQRMAAKEVIVVGHSLGTGVAAKLMAELARQDIYPRALVLIAPFSSLHGLLATYRLAGVIPLLGPFGIIPRVQEFLLGFLDETWDTATKLSNTRSPTLILHATDDTEIPSSHSHELFGSLRAPRDEGSSCGISIIERKGWGSVTRCTSEGRDVVWFEGTGGSHNTVGNGEGVIELIREVAEL